MILEQGASVLEGIVWCLAEYVQLPLGQRIVGGGAAALLLIAVLYLKSSSSAFKARLLQTAVAVLSATSMSISLTMGHSMPEMEFLFLWLPLAGWLSAVAVWLFNKQIIFSAYKPFAFPAELNEKVCLMASRLGLSEPVEAGVFDSGKIEVLSSAGRRHAILVSVGALEAFSQKQLEAVLFHELAHLKNEDSVWKTVCTAGLFSVFAPFAAALRKLAVLHQEECANALALAAYKRHYRSAQKAFLESQKALSQ